MIKTPIPFFRHLAVRFQNDRHGSILPLFGIMLVFIIVVAGASIDVSRAVNAREKLSYALDAAALAAATKLSTSALNDDQVTKIISDSFKANLAAADFLDEAIENMAFTVNSDQGTVTVSTSATMNNLFINLGGYGIDAFGPKAFTFGTKAQVAYSRFDVEMAMVVDVTGSMAGQMSTLRDASKSVVDILIPDGTSVSDSKVKISLVPYSQGVNLGSYATTVTNGASSYQNCVNEREGANKFTDAVYNYDGTNSEFFHGTPKYFINDRGSYEDRSRGYDACPDEEVVPLTANRNTLTTAISDLDSGGGTGGQVGIAWGWYTLSPNWTSLWPSSSDPEAYNNSDVLKFALIMTDGDFNAEYSTEEVRVCSRRSYGCNTTEEWVERYHRYSDITDPPAERAKLLCDAMKHQGIQIYAVFFDTGGSDFGDDLMQYCASDKNHYYEASSSSDLVAAFSNIAKKIQQIYLSK